MHIKIAKLLSLTNYRFPFKGIFIKKKKKVSSWFSNPNQHWQGHALIRCNGGKSKVISWISLKNLPPSIPELQNTHFPATKDILTSSR